MQRRLAGGGGAPRDSAGSGATEEGLTSRGGRRSACTPELLLLTPRKAAARRSPRSSTGEQALLTATGEKPEQEGCTRPWPACSVPCRHLPAWAQQAPRLPWFFPHHRLSGSPRRSLSMPSQARVRWDLVFQGLGASGPHLNRASCTELSQTMPLGPSPLPAGPHPPGPVSPQQPAPWGQRTTRRGSRSQLAGLGHFYY